ncbi:MAG: hypothetical protein JRD89_11950 [Deltaproteobacteria bacterium]|nr:hypothetical protein [Deltaproteobacteria bacterium]
MTKALMIEVKNWTTGERAGGINPRDRGLVAIGGPLWQVLDHEPKGDWEVRLVRDNRDLSGYEGRLILDDASTVSSIADVPADAEILDVEGVVVLENEEEINAALDQIPAKVRGDMDRAKVWGESYEITPRSVAGSIALAAEGENTILPAPRPGHHAVAKRRRRAVEQVAYGHPVYAFVKRLYDYGCPHLWREPIPKV